MGKKNFSFRHSRHHGDSPLSLPGRGGVVKICVTFEFSRLVLSSFIFLGVRGASSKTIKTGLNCWHFPFYAEKRDSNILFVNVWISFTPFVSLTSTFHKNLRFSIKKLKVCTYLVKKYIKGLFTIVYFYIVKLLLFFTCCLV